MVEDVTGPLFDKDWFEVEKIIDERNKPTKSSNRNSESMKEYLVRWKGYDPTYDSWIPASDIGSGQLIYDFREKRKALARSKALIISEPSL